MAGGTAAGPGCIEVGRVAEHIKNHVRRVVSYLRVGVACHVVKEGVDSLHCFGDWVSLLARDFAEGHENGEVDCASIIEEAPNDLLDPSFAFVVEFLAVIFWW